MAWFEQIVGQIVRPPSKAKAAAFVLVNWRTSSSSEINVRFVAVMLSIKPVTKCTGVAVSYVKWSAYSNGCIHLAQKVKQKNLELLWCVVFCRFQMH